MGSRIKNSVNSNQTEESGGDKARPVETGNVPPEERRERVLEFIDEHDMPLPPLAIYAGMVHQQRITFAYRTVQNILSDLVEKGEVFRVDTEKLRDGEIVAVEESGSGRRSYYFITDAGRERINSDD